MKKITRCEALKRGGQITAGAAAGSYLSPILGCAREEEYTPDGKYIRSEPITEEDIIETDLLIIGSGFAGMWAAISAKDHGVNDIAMVDKGAIGDSSKSKTCAGATIYCESGDDIDVWLEEFTRVQRYLSRQDIVSHLFETSESRLKRMQSWGLWYKRMRREIWLRSPNCISGRPWSGRKRALITVDRIILRQITKDGSGGLI